MSDDLMEFGRTIGVVPVGLAREGWESWVLADFEENKARLFPGYEGKPTIVEPTTKPIGWYIQVPKEYVKGRRGE